MNEIYKWRSPFLIVTYGSIISRKKYNIVRNVNVTKSSHADTNAILLFILNLTLTLTLAAVGPFYKHELTITLAGIFLFIKVNTKFALLKFGNWKWINNIIAYFHGHVITCICLVKVCVCGGGGIHNKTTLWLGCEGVEVFFQGGGWWPSSTMWLGPSYTESIMANAYCKLM